MNHQIKKSNLSEERLSKIKKHITENYIDTNKYIGTITAIYKNDNIAFLDIQGMQDRERNIPLKRDSIFRIYSMTVAELNGLGNTLFNEKLISISDKWMMET